MYCFQNYSPQPAAHLGAVVGARRAPARTRTGYELTTHNFPFENYVIYFYLTRDLLFKVIKLFLPNGIWNQLERLYPAVWLGTHHSEELGNLSLRHCVVKLLILLRSYFTYFYGNKYYEYSIIYKIRLYSFKINLINFTIQPVSLTWTWLCLCRVGLQLLLEVEFQQAQTTNVRYYNTFGIQ